MHINPNNIGIRDKKIESMSFASLKSPYPNVTRINMRIDSSNLNIYHNLQIKNH